MSNDKVILAFLNGKNAHTPTRNIQNGYYTYKGQTLSTDGIELINYYTKIAYHKNGVLFLNVEKYSSTTSRIQSKIKRFAEDMRFAIKEYKEEV